MIDILKRMWEIVSHTLGLTKPKLLDAPLVQAGELGTLYIYSSHLYLYSVFEQCQLLIAQKCTPLRYHNCTHLKSWLEFETNYEKVNKWYFIGVWKIQLKSSDDRPTKEVPYSIRAATHAVAVFRGGRFHSSKGKLFFQQSVFCNLYDVLHFSGELDESIVVLVRSVVRKLLTQKIETINWKKEMSSNKYIKPTRDI